MKKILIIGHDDNGKAILHNYRDRGIIITKKEECDELSKNAPEMDLPIDLGKMQEQLKQEYLQINPLPPQIDDIIIYDKPKSKFHK